MNRHLNLFLPYTRAAHHEDQLTRAALIVMTAIPLARDAFLRLIGERPSALLPPVEFDMQTQHVAAGHDDDEPVAIDRLVSVFLTPDIDLDLSDREFVDSDRGQRLDGVMRFGDELVVAIETKVVTQADAKQACEIKLDGLSVAADETPIKALGWHDLLEQWFALLERDLLGPAERVLMGDLVAFTEEHFAHLLPFTTLRRAGNYPLRRQRRLMALLREATGTEEGLRPRHDFDAEILFESSLRMSTFQRFALLFEGDKLTLGVWPAELKPQAKALYCTGRASRLLEFIESDSSWTAETRLHLAYRGALVASQRLYTSGDIPVKEYIRRWSEDDFAWVRAFEPWEVETVMWPMLRERGYVTTADELALPGFMDMLGRRMAHLRPGVAITKSWKWRDALALDERGELAGEIRQSMTEILDVLDEPSLPVSRVQSRMA